MIRRGTAYGGRSAACRRYLPLVLPLVVSACFCLLLAFCDNNPWPRSIADTSTIFAPVTGTFKTLDPATSYYEHEAQILDNILEMPFTYHYLKRPYTLVPMLAEAIPAPAYYDADGKRLPPDPPAEQVARAEYELRIKRGVRYQPHPCFTIDKDGRHPYLELKGPLPDAWQTPSDFPDPGTRELTAEDFKLALTRLCDPNIASPVFSSFKSFLLGMDECSAAMAALGADAPRDYRAIPLAGVRVNGPHSLTIILKRKYPQALYWMAMHFFAPLPWEALAFYAQPQVRKRGMTFDFWPVGTGAFMMEDFRQNDRIVLKRNPYHRPDPYPSEGEPQDRTNGLLADAGHQAPLTERCVFLFERESVPGWIKFIQGYYDINPIPNDMFDTSVKFAPDGGVGLSDVMKAKGISLTSSVRLVSYYYGFNMMDPVYGGNTPERAKLRRAISIAIDCQGFVDIFMNGRGRASHGILPPGITGGDIGPDTFNRYVFDWDTNAAVPVRKSLDVAKRLMAEAGYPAGIGPDGKRLVLSYDNSSAANPGFKSQFLWLRDKLAQIGIELVDNGTDLNRFRDKILTGNWQFMRKGWVADYPDPENFLFLFYGPNAHVPSKGRGANYTNYSNPEYDAVFAKLEAMNDSPERTELIRQATEILRRDAPCVWDYYPTSFNLTHHWLKNYKPHEVAQTFLKFRRIEQNARQQARTDWNKPPLKILAITAFLIAVAIDTAILLSRYRHANRGVVAK